MIILVFLSKVFIIMVKAFNHIWIFKLIDNRLHMILYMD